MNRDSFYVTGGTLPGDAPSYVTRRADEELLQGLNGGEFCYVLTSRQMGKSSLMVRTAQRLQEDGATVVVLDLTALGQNLTAEQWYGGLLSNLARQVGREDELEDRWDEEHARGPLERFFRLLSEEVLPGIESRLLIFVDEIDVVRSLPFSTDEFFAAIRECYNRRTREPALERLTFCLLGVASPSDLIRDSRLTPFNIGRRIELSDFSPEEAYPLAVGLTLGAPGEALRSHESGKILLRRVLYWTGGHPYLTQRLCQALNDAGGTGTTKQVDHLCEELFLQPRAQEKDDNLLFVRERLLRQEPGEAVDRVRLLEAYRRVWRSERRWKLARRVRDDAGDGAATKLLLAGIVASRRGDLRVRNRIYRTVFDELWIGAQMPDAELQRQRAAFRRGLARAGLLGGSLATLFGALAVSAWRSERSARQLSYYSNIRLLQESWDTTVGRSEAIDEILAETENSEFRDWEWRYFRRRRPVATSIDPADAARVATDYIATEDISDVEPPKRAKLQGGEIDDFPESDPVMSPDGKRVAMFRRDRQMLADLFHDIDSNRVMAVVWDVASGRRLSTMRGGRNVYHGASFSPDSSLLALWGFDSIVSVWDIRTGTMSAAVPGGEIVEEVRWAHDGRSLWVRARDASPVIVPIETASRIIRPFSLSTDEMQAFAICADGSRFSLATSPNVFEIFNVWTGQRIDAVRASGESTGSAWFSPNGDRLAELTRLAPNSFAVGVWEIEAKDAVSKITQLKFDAQPDDVDFTWDGNAIIVIAKHRPVIHRLNEPFLTYSLEAGKADSLQVMNERLVLVSGDDLKREDRERIECWDYVANRLEYAFPRQYVNPSLHRLDERFALIQDEPTETNWQLELWDIARRRIVWRHRGFGPISSVLALPGGRRIALTGLDGRMRLIDRATGRHLVSLSGTSFPYYLLGASAARDQIATLSATGPVMNGASASMSLEVWDGRTSEAK